MIHISFAEGRMANRGGLDSWIIGQLKKNQNRLGVKCENADFMALSFSHLIEAVKEAYGKPSVILIDEYVGRGYEVHLVGIEFSKTKWQIVGFYTEKG